MGLREIIDQAARQHGIDPRIMYGIHAGESAHGNRYDVKNDAVESSWGPFQLNRRKGLGVEFERTTGLDVRNPATIPQQAQFVAAYIRKHGMPGVTGNWFGYHGNRDWNPSWGSAGLGSMMAQAVSGPPATPRSSSPATLGSPGAPAQAAPSAQEGDFVLGPPPEFPADAPEHDAVTPQIAMVSGDASYGDAYEPAIAIDMPGEDAALEPTQRIAQRALNMKLRGLGGDLSNLFGAVEIGAAASMPNYRKTR